MSEIFLTAPLRDSLELFRRFKAGEPDAVAEVRAMFPADADCFLCMQPAGSDHDLVVTEDPSNPKVDAIIAPLCAGCVALPLLNRAHRMRQMLIAMFPRLNPRKISVLTPADLRRV
jgi:hypothetical protein